MFRRISLLALLIVILSACNTSGPSPAANTPTTVASSPLPSTSTVTPTPVLPTATAVPPTDTAVPTDTPAPQPYGPENFPEDVNPLTGLKVGDPSILDRRPLSVKIQNFPRGQRPAFGISSADIVFDYYANNGATRFNAIFYGSNAEQVGPIRSARLLDISIVQLSKAIFAFGGADPRILQRIYTSDIASRLVLEGSSNCPPMCRIDPNGFNFLVTDTEELSKYADTKGIPNTRQNLDGMAFDPQTPADGKPGSQVFVHYNRSAYVRWDFDSISHRYLRFQDAAEDDGQGETFAPFMDGLTNEQAGADNVVVLYAPHENLVKRGTAEIIEINLVGSGIAYAFRDDQAYELKWSRSTTDSLVSLTSADGTPFAHKPGSTWYQVIGQTSKVESKDPDLWRFTYGFP